MSITKTTQRPAQTKTEQARPAQAVARLAPTRMPIAPHLAEEYGVSAPQWRVLVEQIFPAARSVEAVVMALEYCRHRNLDIFKKPVHIVPMWSSAKNAMVETVWPGVAEIRTTAHRTKQYAGMDPMIYGPEVTASFEGEVKVDNRWVKQTREVSYYEWIEVTVYRLVAGVRVPYTLRTFWEEAYATTGRGELPNDMWCKRPKGQHMKVAEVAVLRMAFPEELGNEYAAEEMEGKMIETVPVAARPSSGPPTSATEPEAEEQDEESEDAELSEYQKFHDAMEEAFNKATAIKEIERMWKHNEATANGFSDDEFNDLLALKNGRIAQLKAGQDKPQGGDDEQAG